jgi:hypothetical protein
MLVVVKLRLQIYTFYNSEILSMNYHCGGRIIDLKIEEFQRENKQSCSRITNWSVKLSGHGDNFTSEFTGKWHVWTSSITIDLSGHLTYFLQRHILSITV